MRVILFLGLVLNSVVCIAQNKQCNCATDTLMNQNVISCKNIYLSNGAKLYWQFNCKRIWLTLHQKNGKRKIIDTIPIELYGYTFRLGYQLMKEYKKSLLFRTGCPANGPCNFILVNKANGQKITEFGELIYDHQTNKFYDFVIYFSKTDLLTLEYIDSGKTYHYKINSKDFNAVIPEYTFNSIVIKDNVLLLYYDFGVIKVNLKTMRRIT